VLDVVVIEPGFECLHKVYECAFFHFNYALLIFIKDSAISFNQASDISYRKTASVIQN